MAYVSLNPIFIENLHVYHVLGEDFANKIFLMYTEAGFFINLLDEIKRGSIDYIMKENRVYRTPKEYVDDMVSFDNLGIGNFYGIFEAYFVFCLIVFIVFVIHSIVNFTLSRKEKVEFIIYLTVQGFVKMKNRIVSSFKCTWLRIKNPLY